MAGTGSMDIHLLERTAVGLHTSAKQPTSHTVSRMDDSSVQEIP